MALAICFPTCRTWRPGPFRAGPISPQTAERRSPSAPAGPAAGTRVMSDTPRKAVASQRRTPPAKGMCPKLSRGRAAATEVGAARDERVLMLMAADTAQAAGASDPLAWWRDARFGMFIHWGLYALPAGVWKGQEIAGIGEWIMNRARIPVAEYEQLARRFNPVKFDARAWVRVAKDAGMRYIVITAKHHDGFAMYDSPSTAYDIVDATPFHRDPLKELAEACRAEGLRLCFYYSQAQDWHHPDAAGNTWDFPDEERKDFARYFREKAEPQVRELLTQYGPIGLIWFDTPRVITREQSEALRDLVHTLQPKCLVNSRVGHGASDYESAGDNQIPVCVRHEPWETPATLNDTWGFKSNDGQWKSPRTLIRLLVDIVSKGGNYLLNVGPTAEGEIPAPSILRLHQVGDWVRTNAEAIYGTEPSPFPCECDWGAITKRPGYLYLHIFDWPAGPLVVRGLRCRVRRAHLLADAERRPLAVTQHRNAALGLEELRVALPGAAPDPNVSVVVLEIDGEADVDPRPLQATGGAISLEACQADLPAPAALDSVGLAARWTEAPRPLDWTFTVVEPGTFEVELWTSAARRTAWQGGTDVSIVVAEQQLRAGLAEDDRRQSARSPHQHYSVTRCGRVRIERAGACALRLTGISPADAPVPLLRMVRLVPAEQRA